MATIRDVARAAGVSIATVSRVFNGSPRVGEQTANRVWHAATDLDYWPNSAARSLTTSRTHALGVLLPELHGEFFSEVIRGIDLAARQAKFQVLISSSHANSDDMVAAARAMHGRIDGLIVLASEEGTADAVDRISRSSPIVLLSPCCQVKECSAVTLANFDGAQTAVAHLLDLGHRRIAIIKGPTGNVDADQRLRGYRQALIKAGTTPLASHEMQGDFTELSGHRSAEALLRLTPRPTAVFTANDCMAIGLLSGLHDLGITVPNDMAVVGFDDITMARYLSPPLTTVHVNTFELGQCAVQLLLSRLWSSDPASCSQEILPATLVVRSSCGSARPREQLIESI